jgi:hypothetical protein
MAHFAELNETNTVLRVVVINNDDIVVDGIEVEQKGIDLCVELFGGTWIKTSYNNSIRGTYAGIGYSYNAVEDIFISPQPYPSWIRTGSFWDAPISMPTDDASYSWNETEQSWDLVE